MLPVPLAVLACLVVALSVEPVSCTQPRSRVSSLGSPHGGPLDSPIPRILHHIFLAGTDAYEQLAKEGRMRKDRKESCTEHHTSWEHKFWAKAEADALVQQEFEWFAPTYFNYSHWVNTSLHARSYLFSCTVVTCCTVCQVKQGDSLRYMLMYKVRALQP